MEDKQLFQSKGIGDRILLGSLSLVMLLVSGALIVYFANSMQGGLARLLILEIVSTVSFLSLLCFIWAVAAPRFIENLLWRTAVKVMIVFFLIAVGLLVCIFYYIG